jgi:hypothetical protein
MLLYVFVGSRDSDLRRFRLRSSRSKVHDIGKWRVAIYPNDHRPAHVHVIGGGGEAVFILNCPGGSA